MVRRCLRWSCSALLLLPVHGTPLPPMSSVLEQRLAAALERVRTSVHDFDSLRVALQGETISHLQGLTPDEVSLLQGSRSLESEFSSLQQRATPLLGTEGELQEETAAPFLSDLELFEQELNAHLSRVRSVLASRIGPEPSAARSSIHSSVPLQGIQGSQGSQTISPGTDKRLSQTIQVITDTMGRVEQVQMQVRQRGIHVDPSLISESQQLDLRFKGLQQKGSELASSTSEPMRETDASQYCNELENFSRDLAEMLQRLSASSGSVGGSAGGSPYGGGGNAAAHQKVTLNPLGTTQMGTAPPKVTMGTMPPASLGGPMGAMPMSSLGRAPNGGPAPWDIISSVSDAETDPLSGMKDFCTRDSVAKAADRFDGLVKQFNKKGVKEEMNKPQLDNLQRVVHGLQVLRHSLISELGTQADAAQLGTVQSNTDLLSSCGRYFQGVDQLESDLVYFREQSAKAKADSKSSKKSKSKAINSVRQPKERS